MADNNFIAFIGKPSSYSVSNNTSNVAIDPDQCLVNQIAISYVPVTDTNAINRLRKRKDLVSKEVPLDLKQGIENARSLVETALTEVMNDTLKREQRRPCQFIEIENVDIGENCPTFKSIQYLFRKNTKGSFVFYCNDQGLPDGLVFLTAKNETVKSL